MYAGILSFGLSCQGNIDNGDIESSGNIDTVYHVPGFFTSVCQHVSWIEDTIQQEDGKTRNS